MTLTPHPCVVADMVADTAADMEVHLVADKVAGTVADKGADKQKNILADMELDMEADKEVDKVADMVAGHGCWLIGPKLFRPEAYLKCVSSKLCEFIHLFVSHFDKVFVCLLFVL